MKQKIVYLMCGIPGSGKSTWVQGNLVENRVWVSRDAIRFSLLKDGDEYFANEDKVFDIFISEINKALMDENTEVIYIDATHLNKISRDRVLNRFHFGENVTLNAMCFITPVQICQERNAKRPGIVKVPSSVINSMNQRYRLPDFTERFDNIYTIDENNEIVKIGGKI